MSGVTSREPVLRLSADGRVGARDTLAAEEPLEIRVGGRQIAVTMRTPGDDFDLVAGFLVGEGVVRGRAELARMRFCGDSACSGPVGLGPSGGIGLGGVGLGGVGLGFDGEETEAGGRPAVSHDPYNIVDVDLAPGTPAPNWSLNRTTYTTSACGVCGKTSIEAVRANAHWRVQDDPLRVTPAYLYSLPVRLRERQKVFAKTGGLHAAGLFSAAGEPLCVREDVGRHNAVDKVVGWALREGLLPLRGTALAVSGRASFELVQKAAAAGIPLLAAVSAPSSLAVELARDAGLTLVGFIRGESANVYTGAERVTVATVAASA